MPLLQAQITNLLEELQEWLKITYIFVARNLAVVRQTSHRVEVMYQSGILETAECDELYRESLYPYTTR